MSLPTLTDILGHPEHNGLYRLPQGATVAGARILDGRQLTDKPAMLDAIAKALTFPAWFGQNWDALEDSLADLSWHEGGVALLIEAADTPEHRAPDDSAMLFDILAGAADYWATEKRPFAVFLRGSHAAYPMIAA